MTAIPLHVFAIDAAAGGVLRPFAPAVPARNAAVLEDRSPASPAPIVLLRGVHSC